MASLIENVQFYHKVSCMLTLYIMSNYRLETSCFVNFKCIIFLEMRNEDFSFKIPLEQTSKKVDSDKKLFKD